MTKEEVNLRIMRAHVEQLKLDDDGLLSLRKFADYHHEEFETLGLPRSAFAGTPFFGELWEAEITGLIWCRDCPKE